MSKKSTSAQYTIISEYNPSGKDFQQLVNESLKYYLETNSRNNHVGIYARLSREDDESDHP